jgi:hypothetical protein
MERTSQARGSRQTRHRREREPSAEKRERDARRERETATQTPEGRTPPWVQEQQGSASPMLVIPLRPNTAAVWENQSIKVKAPDGGSIPQTGVENQVSVMIRNVGALPALSVTVDFRVMVASIFLPSTMVVQPIGVADNLRIDGGREVKVVCPKPWIPGFAITDIHECLIVMCWALNDMQDLQWWQPQTERRAAQRNISEWTMAPGEIRPVSFDFPNLLPMRAFTQLLGSVEEVRLPGLRKPSAELLSHVLQASAAAEIVREGSDPRLRPLVREHQTAASPRVALRATLSERIGVFAPVQAGHQFANIQIVGNGMTRASASRVTANMMVLQEVAQDPFELRRADLQVAAPEEAGAGEIILYRFAQVTEGVLMGGYTIMVRIQH